MTTASSMRSLGAFTVFLSLGLLAIAGAAALIGYRGDVIALAWYGVAVFHCWRHREQRPFDAIRIVRSDVPVYVQVADQILNAIDAGVVRPGEKMPTVRQLAVALRVDFNTIRQAYDILVQAGAINVQPAQGAFVAEWPPKPVLEGRIGRSPVRDSLASGPVALDRCLMRIKDRREACP